MSLNKSAREKQLEEQYEEAALALAIYRMMCSEGRELLEENRRLKAGTEVPLPEELDGRVRRRIEKRLGKKRLTDFLAAAEKPMARLAAAMLAVVLLLGVPYATVSAFRSGLSNFIITPVEGGMMIHPDSGEPVDDDPIGRGPHWFPWDEWVLERCIVEEGEIYLDYVDPQKNSILYQEISDDWSWGKTVDLEEAIIDDQAVIQGFPGMTAVNTKKNVIYLLWKDTDRAVTCDLLIYDQSGRIDLETALKIAESIR